MIFPSSNRRGFLKKSLALGALGLTPKSASFGETLSLKQNAVIEENLQYGSLEWQLRKTRVTPPVKLWHMYGLRSPWIEGYCSHPSISVGETLQVFVSTDPISEYTLDVFRMGYYGGAGARRVASYGPLIGVTQPTPIEGTNRVIECAWEPSLEIEIPEDWLSGVYLGKLKELKNGLESYIIFIVKDNRKADFLFQCSDMTWQAYNRWPYNHSLYCDGERDWHIGSGVDVGIDRPYGKYTQLVDQPLTLGSGEWFLTEFPLAYWMEEQGYNVSYISNWDTHYDGNGLLRAKGFLSVGHDEYWTQEMFDNAKAAIDHGVNFAFLSGNSVFCKTKLKPGADGRPDRVFERDGRFDPRENTLMGAHSTGPVIGGAPWTCKKPDHWIFEGTGMKDGDGIPGLVGWEFHGDPADIPGLEIVASHWTDRQRHPSTNKELGDIGEFTSTIYPGPKDNFVFNAATCWWVDGLSAPPGYLRSDWYQPRNGPDSRVQQITANILNRMIS